jgi:hypothetical protein
LALHDLDGTPDKAVTPGNAIWGINRWHHPTRSTMLIALSCVAIRSEKVVVQIRTLPPCQSAFSPPSVATNQSGFGRASFAERIVARLPKAR